MKYCNDCKRNVKPSKKFSIGWFIFNCLWLIGGVVYIIYYFGKSKVCPICGGNHLEASREDIVTTSGETISVTSKQAKQERFEQSCVNTHNKKLEMRAKLEVIKERKKQEKLNKTN